MMQIGCSWQYEDADQWELAQAAGFRWCKVGVGMGMADGFEQLHRREFAWAAAAKAIGIEPVLDLRCGVSEFGKTAPPEAWRWDRIGQRWENDDLFWPFADWCGRVVRETGLRHFEVWGEAPCMSVGERFFKGETYTNLLATVNVEISAANNQARVWFGGHGVNGLVLDWQAAEPEARYHYDVQNLHPFFHDREWGKIKLAAQGMFSTLRLHGNGQSVGMTEFGWPTHRDGAGIPFKSNVVDAVLSCSEQQAAEWTDGFFRICEAAGVQVVIWNNLVDTDGTHWGEHCGLLRSDGTPKTPLWDVVRDWTQRGRKAPITL